MNQQDTKSDEGNPFLFLGVSATVVPPANLHVLPILEPREREKPQVFLRDKGSCQDFAVTNFRRLRDISERLVFLTA
jgi:hypothetical protein